MKFDREFMPHHGDIIPLASGVQRITAPNTGPYTFHGTNSYLIGEKTPALIDPGPDNDDHLNTILRALNGRQLSHIVITHGHHDHVALLPRLQDLTGAKVAAFAKGTASAFLDEGNSTSSETAKGQPFEPDIELADDSVIAGDGWALRTIHTPGHASDHCAFALEGTDICFSGDHVMAWSTTVVSPPDGNMADYMTSLDRLMARHAKLLLPGHGGPVTRPNLFMRGLKAHRRMRERAILARIESGDRQIADIVEAIYRDTDPRLLKAASGSVLAHIEDMVTRGLVTTDGPVTLFADYRPA